MNTTLCNNLVFHKEKFIINNQKIMMIDIFAQATHSDKGTNEYTGSNT